VALEYENIARGLKAAFVAGCFDTPQKWCAVTADDCHKTFSIPKAAHPLLDELMRLFADHLQETGRQMMNLYGGSVRALLNDAGKSAARFVSIVSQWPTFADMTRYHGRDIFVLKRAQILAADIHLAFGNSYFDDIADLTMFADNMVAHVLWCDGVLSYAPDLANRIARGEMIASGSDEETELRCVAIHAVELIKAATGGAVTSVNIDHILWNRGYEPEIYKTPTHRTLTTWY